MSKLTVLVTGATGSQGGSVAAALIVRGHAVRALTRKPGSPAAIKLAKAGAEIATGDFGEAGTVVAAAKGVDTVFLMGNSWEGGADRERELGQKAVTALVRARVGHVIYSSVNSADRATGVPHFESKAAVERHLAASGLPYTISAPASFMDNHLAPWAIPDLQQGVLAAALPPARKLKKIAVADIGPFVAALAERRERVFGRRFDIAGDDIDGSKTAATLSRFTGRRIRYQQLPLDVVRQQSDDVARMYAWFNDVGYNADIAALKRDFPEVTWHSFADWAQSVDWNVVLRPSGEPAATPGHFGTTA